jgi:uncharacterized alkaline shock family protein YloU
MKTEKSVANGAVDTSDMPAQRGSSEKAGNLVSSHGKTSIADSVVAKVAGMAARQVNGVYDMGGGMARAIGAVRERIPGNNSTTNGAARGVAVEVGERQAAIDIGVVVEYGVSIPDLASAIRRNVIQAVEHMCGLEVTEVNINVSDINLPGEESDNGNSDDQPRVQ